MEGARGGWSRTEWNSSWSLWAGTDAEETILNAFKMLDPEGKGSINKD